MGILTKPTNFHQKKLQMNTFNKVLISSAFALLASTSEAKSIHNSCLTMSDQTAGAEDGEFITNEDQLTSNAVTDQMRIHSIKTCMTRGEVTGLQFIMALNPYESVDEELFEMKQIGNGGVCQRLELPEGLDNLEASFSSEA